MIELKNLHKSFTTEDGNVEALRNVSLTIAKGDIYGIIGESGAGKSTLVRCINMLERPNQGEVLIDGVNLCSLTEKELRSMHQKIGFVFQSFNLLMQTNCLKNVLFPLKLSSMSTKEAETRAFELLDLVGLKDKAFSYPSQLSGGQQQRVAIARALAMNPSILLCDEATSALDPNTTNSILSLIKEINERFSITVVIITHQMSVVEAICNRVAIIDKGEVVEQGSVTEIFSSPKSESAKRLVFPTTQGSSREQKPSIERGSTTDAALAGLPLKHVIRVVFQGSESTNTPLIAKMAIEKGIEANITYAQTRVIAGNIYGSMLLDFPTAEQAKAAIEFLSNSPNVQTEEVSLDV